MLCRCGEEAVIRLKQYRRSFCSRCFVEFYENKVEGFIRKHRLLRPGERVFVAVSGGKDSASCLAVLKRLSEKFAIELSAFHINLGIGEYSRRVEEASRRLCEKLDVELEVVDVKAVYGVGVEEVAKSSRRKPCSACGIIKRYLMNKIPRELGADRLATGHNLEDTVEFFFKNWASGNYFWLSKQKPLLPSNHPKVLTKIKPLFERSEKENETYAKILNLPYEEGKCPHSVVSRWREVGEIVEERVPGFKLSIARGLEKLNIVVDAPRFKSCKVCGEPSSGDVCSFCRLIGRV